MLTNADTQLPLSRAELLRIGAGTALAAALPVAVRADDTLLRMATINIDSTAQPYYALEGGFFKSAGLKVEFQQFNNGQAIAAAVAGGALDVAVSNVVAMTQAHAKNVPFVIVAPGAVYLASDPTTVLMVPKNSPIQSARDLAGKTVACNGINGIPEYCTRAWVDKAGADSSSMKFLEMNFAQMMDALGAARVDAACVTEPFITEAKTTGRAIGLPFDACAPRFLLSVYIATREWANANRDTVKRFQTANAQTAAWANHNLDKTADILMKYTKLPDATVKTMRRAVFAEKWNASDAQPVVDLTAKYANVPRFAIDDMLFRA
jgi:NitT/TauT family transport system substrate-binding protein